MLEYSGIAAQDLMPALMQNEVLAKKMGQQARLHVEANFSRAAFGSKLEAILLGLVRKARTAKQRLKQT